ncbi:hypothetical protein TNCV_127231 [Trichonephila clavipes]|nr:hypothetical protein TNCV_127231 [Trichonephila clavipes]
MNEDRTTKKVFNVRLIGTWRKFIPNLRWIDGLEKVLLGLRTKNWRTLAWKKADILRTSFLRRPRSTLGCILGVNKWNGCSLNVSGLKVFIMVLCGNSEWGVGSESPLSLDRGSKLWNSAPIALA